MDVDANITSFSFSKFTRHWSNTVYYISDTLINEGTHNWHRLLYVCGMCSCGDRHKSTIF